MKAEILPGGGDWILVRETAVSPPFKVPGDMDLPTNTNYHVTVD